MAHRYGEKERILRPEKKGALAKALLVVLAAVFIGAAVAYLVVPFEPTNALSQIVRAMIWW